MNYIFYCRRWEIILCYHCGSTGIHLACGGLSVSCKEWNCPTCSSLLQKHSKVKRRIISKRRSFASSSKRTFSKGLEMFLCRLNNKPSLPASNDSKSIISIDKFRQSCGSSTQDSSRTPASNVLPSGASVSYFNSDELSSTDELTFLKVSFIRDLISKGVSLPKIMEELKSYVESLPNKLISYKYDTVTFLHFLNTYIQTSTDVYKINYWHYMKFLNMEFNLDQMEFMHKLFEMVFLISKTKAFQAIKEKKLRNNPFLKGIQKHRKTRLDFGRKRLMNITQSLIDHLAKAKKVFLLEGNNTWDENPSLQPQNVSLYYKFFLEFNYF